MLNTSTQALENLKREMQNEDRELQNKSQDLKRKEDEIKRKKAELEKLESEATIIRTSVAKLESQRQHNEREISMMQQELQRAIKR